VWTTFGSDVIAVRKVLCKTAATRSGLPGLDWALNPYRGCGHACSYCYAQDVTRFELSRQWGETVEAKVNFVQILKKQLEKRPEGTFGLGTVTDPYQKAEKELELSRRSLSELRRAGSTVSILTKSDLVLRDMDVLSGWREVEVGVSIGVIDEGIASHLEPGAPSPRNRFEVLRRLSNEGTETYLMAAPIIPGVCDSVESLENMVRTAAGAGVKRIIWDMYNPKPIANIRLRNAMAKIRTEPKRADDQWVNHVREVLGSSCGEEGVELSDAF
jgi:DNA repair photolyase